MAERARFDQKSPAQGHPRRVDLLVFVLFMFCSAISEPALACLCSCEGNAINGSRATTADATSDQYDQVFSGLVISTKRIDEPVAEAAVSGDGFVEDPGHWIRSRMLVIRVWRGAPSTMAELWTPVATNCDLPPIAGSYFVAAARTEKGRSVASNSLCECDQKAALTAGRGTFALTSVAIIGTAICAAAIVLLMLGKVIRRVRRSG
jgi:hypothetical protein